MPSILSNTSSALGRSRAWLIALALLARAAPALAQGRESAGPSTDETRLESKRLSAQGLEAFDAGRYDEAIEAFRRSYALTRAPGLLYNVAQAFRLKGDCRQALAHYRDFLSTNPTGTLRTYAQAQLSKLEPCSSEPTASSPIESPETEGPLADPAEPPLAPMPTQASRATPGIDERRSAVSATRPVTGRGERAIVGVGLTPTVARDLASAVGVRLGYRSGVRHGALATLDITRAHDHGVSEWQLLGSVGWSWGAKLGAVHGWLGANGGGGIVAQTKAGSRSLLSAVVALGPTLGLGARPGGPFGVWAEAQLFGLGYRADDETLVSLAPSAWCGGSFDL